jgi:hypothetical protein
MIPRKTSLRIFSDVSNIALEDFTYPCNDVDRCGFSPWLLVNSLSHCSFLARPSSTLSCQLHGCYNLEEEADLSSSTISFSKRWLRRSASAAIPLRIAVVDEQKRFTLTTMCERRIV